MIEVGRKTVQDPEHPAAALPLIARGPAAAIDKVRLDRFDYGDQQLIEKREAAVHAMARGVDMPFETTVGYSETSFANAFAIGGQISQIYVASWLDLYGGFMTFGWLTSLLMKALKLDPLGEEPPDDVGRLCVWHDMSGLVTTPNPEKVAQWAYGTDTNPNSIIGPSYVRSMLNIPETAKPTDEQTAERLERSKQLRARAEQGSKTDTDPEDGVPEKDQGDGERDTNEEVGKRAAAIADLTATLAVDRAGSKLRARVGKTDKYGPAIKDVASRNVAQVLGPQVVETLGGTAPLLNGAFDELSALVAQMFNAIDHPDAVELGRAAGNLSARTALARLFAPGAALDEVALDAFMELVG
jgi:hypothetical protein